MGFRFLGSGYGVTKSRGPEKTVSGVCGVTWWSMGVGFSRKLGVPVRGDI